MTIYVTIVEWFMLRVTFSKLYVVSDTNNHVLLVTLERREEGFLLHFEMNLLDSTYSVSFIRPKDVHIVEYLQAILFHEKICIHVIVCLKYIAIINILHLLLQV